MASLLGYWRTPAQPKFPTPPRNPLVYLSSSSHESPSTLTASDMNDHMASQRLTDADISFDPELRDSHTDNSTALEEIPFAEFHATNEREEHSEYKLIVKRYISKDLIKPAVEKWRASLSWLPTDVPTSLELGEIRPVFVPVYLYSAQLDLYCSGKYDTFEAGVKKEVETEISTKDELNELYAFASTEPVPDLLDELLNAKAFYFPSNSASAPGPSVPRHPYHSVKYRNSLFAPALTVGSSVLQCDISETLANSMISDFLTSSAGPYLATQAFQAQFGINSRSLSATCSIRSLVRHLLFLPLYLTSYDYHGHSYQVLVSGVNGHVAGQRMSYGSGSIGRALVSFSSGLSNVIHKNI